MNRTNVFFYFFLCQTFTRVTVTASAIVSHYSKEKKKQTLFFHTSFFSLCRTHLMLTNIRGRCLGVQKTFIWSHTAFKRTCKTACIVKSLSLKLDVVLSHFIFQSALNRSSHQQWMCWTESWCCCLAKVFSFSLHPALLFCLFRCCFISPKDFWTALHEMCCRCSCCCFIWYHRLRADIVCFTVAFKNPFQVSFLCLPLEKASPEPLCFFFLTRALKVWRSGSGRSWSYTHKLWSEVLVSFISRIHLLPVGKKKVIVSKWL